MIILKCNYLKKKIQLIIYRTNEIILYFKIYDEKNVNTRKHLTNKFSLNFI